MPNNDKYNDDDYVAKLLAEDAKKSSVKYASIGLSALLPKRSAKTAPKPNTRFLSHLVREVDSHNAALKKKEELEAKIRLREIKERDLKRRREEDEKNASGAVEKDRRKKSKRQRLSDEVDGAHNDRHERHRRKKEMERERDRENTKHKSKDEKNSREYKRSESSGKPSRRVKAEEEGKDTKSRSRSSEYSKESSSRMSTRKYDEKSRSDYDRHYSSSKPRLSISLNRNLNNPRHKRFRSTSPTPSPSPPSSSSASSSSSSSSSSSNSSSAGPASSDPLSNIVASLRSGSKGRKSDYSSRSKPNTKIKRKATSNIDHHFSPHYDPTKDIHPDSDSDLNGDAGTGRDGSDWDMALEALRDRNSWKKKQADRLREAGFGEDEIRRWESRNVQISSAGGVGVGGGGNRERDKDVRDVKWKKQGEAREWDLGKEGFQES